MDSDDSQDFSLFNNAERDLIKYKQIIINEVIKNITCKEILLYFEKQKEKIIEAEWERQNHKLKLVLVYGEIIEFDKNTKTQLISIFNSKIMEKLANELKNFFLNNKVKYRDVIWGLNNQLNVILDEKINNGINLQESLNGLDGDSLSLIFENSLSTELKKSVRESIEKNLKINLNLSFALF